MIGDKLIQTEKKKIGDALQKPASVTPDTTPELPQA